jgi:AraC-like DNA-binding protein
MQISIEQISLEADRSFQAYEYNFPDREQPLHAHEEFELATVSGTGGILYCGADTSEFFPGDLFLFGRKLPHRFISGSGAALSRAGVIQFRKDAFGEGFFGLPENRAVWNLLEKASGGLAFRGRFIDAAKGLDRVISGDASRRLPHLLLLLADMAELNSRGDSEFLSSRNPFPGKRPEDAERLSKLQDLIESSYTGKITIDRAAGTLALTGTSFCRYVKKTTGRTFTALVNDYRLTAAAMMLRDSSSENKVIAAVAEDVGFGSLSHFNARFRSRYGMTPAEYRAAARRR